MKKISIVIVLLVALLSGAVAQRATMFRINEVMPYNVDNYMDDYGKKSAWIELFNNSPASVNLAGCYLTNDLSNPKMYHIAKGDVLTLIKPRQHVVFWADNMPHHGTFHLNFALDSIRSNFVALFDANGTTLIDSITIPPMQADRSFGRLMDGSGEWGVMAKVTPSTNNLIVNGNESIEKFKLNDPIGIGMSVTAMSVVFIALIVLYLVFKWIGNYALKLAKRNATKGIEQFEGESSAEVSGEVFAAIAMALHEFQNDAHDLEETVLTINRVTRNYSPWSSKIYGLREQPRK